MPRDRRPHGDAVQFLRARSAQAWIDPARKRPRTLHHLGKGRFVVDGRTITLPSQMK